MGTTAMVDEKKREIFIEYFNKIPSMKPTFKLVCLILVNYLLEAVVININTEKFYSIFMNCIIAIPFINFVFTYIFGNQPYFYQRINGMSIVINLLNSLGFRILYESLPFFKKNYYWIILLIILVEISIVFVEYYKYKDKYWNLMENRILDTSQPIPRYVFVLTFPIGIFLVRGHLELVGVVILALALLYLLKKTSETCVIAIQSKKIYELEFNKEP